MNKYRIENPNNNKVREYKSRTTENGSHYDRVTLLDSKDTFESRDNPNYIPHMVDIGEKFI